MPTVFSRIIAGELPARFVWSDARCVAFLSINPVRPGHTLVVPRIEVEHWVDLDSDDYEHLMAVAKGVGRAIDRAYRPGKVALMFVGLEVPHVHAHLVPIDTMEQLDFRLAERDPDPAALDDAAERIRAALTELGYEEVAS